MRINSNLKDANITIFSKCRKMKILLKFNRRYQKKKQKKTVNRYYQYECFIVASITVEQAVSDSVWNLEMFMQ